VPIESSSRSEEAASVFIVEDEALIVMELRDRLTALGYTVRGAASRGEQALEAIAADPPGVVLMDIHLAGAIDGIETARRLRAQADVPVIFLSAYSDADLLNQAGKVEPFGYLVKPFEVRELHATIQMALYKHRIDRSLRESNTRLDEKVRERTRELAESRENLAVTLNSIGDAVLATDAQGRITRLNPVAERLTGWSEADAMGRPIAEVFRIVNEATRQPAIMPVDDVLATGEPHTLANHTALISRDGREIGIADSAAPIRDATGRIVGVVLVFRDETEARERRKLIARQRTMLSALRRVQEQFINSPEGSRTFDDILSVLLYATNSAYGFIGEVLYSPQGAPYLKTQAMSDIAWNDEIRQLLAERGSEGLEFSRLTSLFGAVMSSGKAVIANEPASDPRSGGLPMGHPELTSFLGAPINVGDRAVGMIGVANRPGGYDDGVLAEIQPLLATYGNLILARRDAARRRAAEQSLRELNSDLEGEVRRRTAALLESEQRYSDLVENINDAIIRVAADGRLVYANRRFLEWFGLEGRELRDITVDDYAAPEWRQIIRDRHARRMRGERAPERYEFEGATASGERLWLDVYATPVVEEGQVVGTQALIRDITDRKNTERQARRAQRLEAIGTLAGGIAHDLNNALTPILMMLDLLKVDYPNEAAALETVSRSANHAAQMVRHLLAFAKGTSGKQVALQPLRLLEEVATIVKSTFPKNIQVEMRGTKVLPMVVGDATQLHQVLINLCVNARDAMPEGGTLTLETYVAENDCALTGQAENGIVESRRYVVLRVSDTGMGMAQEVIERIFDPFFTTKGPEAGSGLGLFSAAGIVKGHGGFIKVDSRLQFGSTFAVYLPAVESSSEADPVDPQPAGFVGQGETILYVDDEPNVRSAAETVLRRLKFTPLLAADGVSGLLRALEHRATLSAVITDLHMPKMDGLAFVRALRRALPEVPVIVASGRLDRSIAAEFGKLGVHVTLDKPFTQTMLAESLRAALPGC
jgi:PAS domain S-box-containing protein